MVLAHRDLPRGDTGDLGYLLLQAADTGLMGVAVDDLSYGGLVYAEHIPAQAVFLQLLGNQILLGDFSLLLRQISGHVDEFHPVQQRRLYGGCGVGGGDEEDIRQVIVDV